MSWKAHIEGTIRHVWPEDEDHDTSTTECWCGPKVVLHEGGIILVTHNSKDGREYVERLISDAKDNVN
jgi:hypothetical protein